MRNKTVLLFLCVALSSVAMTACFKEPPEEEAKRVLAQETEDTDVSPAMTGYEYAEKAEIEDEVVEKAIAKAGEIIDIESIDSYMNDTPANRDVNTIDLRVANVTGKDGKKYTICFDGIRGTLYGLIDENGNDLADKSAISEDFSDIVLGDTYVAPESEND